MFVQPFHRLSIAYAVAQWLLCRIYGGGDYMPLGNTATIAAVVGTNHAVRHQFEFDWSGSIHIKCGIAPWVLLRIVWHILLLYSGFRSLNVATAINRGGYYVIHTKKWFPSHAEDVIVGIVALWGGNYEYPQRTASAIGCAVNKFQHISTIIWKRVPEVCDTTQLNHESTW